MVVQPPPPTAGLSTGDWGQGCGGGGLRGESHTAGAGDVDDEGVGGAPGGADRGQRGGGQSPPLHGGVRWDPPSGSRPDGRDTMPTKRTDTSRASVFNFASRQQLVNHSVGAGVRTASSGRRGCAPLHGASGHPRNPPLGVTTTSVVGEPAAAAGPSNGPPAPVAAIVKPN